MGRSMTEVSRNDGPITPTTAALGPDLYSGSSGMALFLAQLFAMTGDQACLAYCARGNRAFVMANYPAATDSWPTSDFLMAILV